MVLPHMLVFPETEKSLEFGQKGPLFGKNSQFLWVDLVVAARQWTPAPHLNCTLLSYKRIYMGSSLAVLVVGVGQREGRQTKSISPRWWWGVYVFHAHEPS